MTRVKRTLVVASIVSTLALVALVAFVASQRQRADNDWDPQVDRPTYQTRHPRVAIDQAHYNPHTADGKYRPFARLLTADGYQVSKGQQAFTPASLASIDVLVIVNPAGGPRPQVLGINIPIPTKKKREMPAFSPEEIESVRTWVEQGGSLLLISDHAPFGTAAKPLAAAFGVTMNEGFVEDPKAEQGPAGGMVFSTENGLLGDHPIISGDGAHAGVQRVMTFTGQSLDGPPEASVLLRLPESAIEYVPPGPELKEQRAGQAQALALSWGGGRVVVLGEAAMLTAQLDKGTRFGMNLRENDNRQLALNIMHWLSRQDSQREASASSD